MTNFLTFLQEAHKTKESLSDYIKNVSDEEILEAIELYVQYRNIKTFKSAKENARFESGSDKTGFIYMTQLRELLNLEEI